MLRYTASAQPIERLHASYLADQPSDFPIAWFE
jgi:hypothetical protein